MGPFALAVGAASAVLAAALAGLDATPAAAAVAAGVPTVLPLYVVLADTAGAARLHTLPDGRQLKAEVLSIGGCVSSPLVSGTPRGSSASAYTVLRQNSGPPCVLVNGTAVEVPTFVGVQAIRVWTNGFRFTGGLRVEDIDASTRSASQAAAGWREAATVLGRGAGQLVRPTLHVAADALVAVHDAAVAGSTLAAAGWPGYGDQLLRAVSYASWRRVENLGEADAALGATDVQFLGAIDDLLILYALSQPTLDDPGAATAALVSGLSLSAGCQCASGRPSTRSVAVPVDDGGEDPGRCSVVSVTVNAFVCDFQGTTWCETVASRTYVATSALAADGTVACERRGATIQRPVSPFTPVKNWGSMPS